MYLTLDNRGDAQLRAYKLGRLPMEGKKDYYTKSSL